ncbi:hypothetical protein F8388_023533 [Cannabis sativa]|uniref:Uncharacterized protein n=1 Tax=Cannabis sativa TaxID=3483 RepID=A0A7J6EG85_CANSA|nr:hypothetical protein F8388_023533 [Cannabis sativa]
MVALPTSTHTINNYGSPSSAVGCAICLMDFLEGESLRVLPNPCKASDFMCSVPDLNILFTNYSQTLIGSRRSFHRCLSVNDVLQSRYRKKVKRVSFFDDEGGGRITGDMI